jgi:DNA-binding beta-propeller fold protein YncE
MRWTAARWAVPAALALLAIVAACSGGGGGTEPTAPTPNPPGIAGEHQFTFESGPVRPLAMSPDGTRLFVANTAAATLDILTITATGMQLESSVPVGLEPVAVAVRNAGEVWVVNHLSDSVSVVDVASAPARIAKTLLVGDEPRDIVFAGADRQRAFITTAHRGQQRASAALAGVPGAGDPQLTTAGVGRADVWVFDARQLGDTTLGGRPLAILSFNADTPRALAATPDGSTVYVAAHHSGNQTTAVSSLLTCDGFDSDVPCTMSGNAIPGSALGPATNHAGLAAPRVGLIAKTATDGSWRDAKGRDWSGVVRFSLPDNDVFAFDANTLATTASFAHVGTTLFNMAVHPKTGAVYVSNTESRNDLRFEGPGTFAGTTLRGHLAESRITVLGGTTVAPRHLNKHIPYGTSPTPPNVKQHSLATPLEMVLSTDGSTLYVAAFGSGKVGVFPVGALEDNSFDPTQLSANHLAVSGGGPSGLVLDEARGRLYVATRFDNGVSAVDLGTRQETAHLLLATPESQAIIAGRRFLYDATVSSSNGEASCASCHIFGNTDHLSWDLGNPDGDVTVTPINIKLGQGGAGTQINGSGDITALHPMKGPMATQTLRGMVNHGAMHWRGDRVAGFFGTDTRTAPPFDSELAFKNFIVAFDGLHGLDTPFSSADMQSFANFTLAVVPPPNPVRSLDNSLNAAQARGRSYFMGCDGLDSVTGAQAVCDVNGLPIGAGHFSDGRGTNGNGFTCQGCHVLSPANGFFGTDGQFSFEALPQTMKIPHLRNLYEKVGMFGTAANSSENPGDNGHQGPQMRGFGFANDGAVDSLFRFFQGKVFNSAQSGRVGFDGGDAQRRDVEAFMLAFDSDLAPVVGQQITLDSGNAAVAGPRVDLLRSRASAAFTSKMLGGRVTECELVVRGVINGRATTFAMRADGSFGRDDGAPAVSDAELRQLAQGTGQQLTYTCLPTGWAPKL